jgi:glycosyltransferase involved in cell wall biosynthesis
MKIAIVVPGGVDRSGECRVIPAFLALIARLARAHEVHVFARRQEPVAGSWPLAGAQVHDAGGSAPRLVSDILAEHRRGPFAVVQSLFGGGDALLAIGAARWLRVPVAVHLAGGELVAMHDIGYGGWRHWRGRWVRRLVLRGADALSAASRPMIESLARLGYPARRLPLGVDRNAWPPLEPRVRGPGEPLRLVHVASLNPVKDQSTLLQALAVVADAGCEFELEVIGEDTLSGSVQRLAHSLGLGARIRFRGFRTQRELQEIVRGAHPHIMSSRHEAGPIALLEAAHAGVPTAGTRVGHLAEWAPAAALAVPVADSRALATAIQALYHDEARRLALAREAQRRALAEDADFTAHAFEQLFNRLRRGSGGESGAPARELAGEVAREPGAVLAQRSGDPLPAACERERPRDAPGDGGGLPAP